MEWLALLAGCVLLLVGVLGLVPGATTRYGELRFAGEGSHAQLFGVFRVSILLNLVHVLGGLAGIALSRTSRGALAFLVSAGVASLGLWLVGVAAAGSWIPLEAADNWLHFGVGLALLGLARAARQP